MATEKIDTRSAYIDMEMSSFELPPSGDVLVLGKHCPIGPTAAKKMLDYAAPDYFELIRCQDEIVEAMLVNKSIFYRVEKERFINMIIDEVKKNMGPACMISVSCNITVKVAKRI